MKTILIFRHVAYEGPGYLADFLSSRNMDFEVICIDKGDHIPDSLDEISGLVFMGGPMSVNDPLPWIMPELELIRHAHQRNIPILGHCLGAQLISKALGGTISVNPVKEIGWFPVSSYASCLTPFWLDNLPGTFNVFHLHGEQFSIPQGATLLLQSKYCLNQAFTIDNTLALQFHVEVTPEIIHDWINVYKDDLIEPSASVQTASEILYDLEERVASAHKTADVLYSRWLDGI